MSGTEQRQAFTHTYTSIDRFNEWLASLPGKLLGTMMSPTNSATIIAITVEEEA